MPRGVHHVYRGGKEGERGGGGCPAQVEALQVQDCSRSSRPWERVFSPREEKPAFESRACWCYSNLKLQFSPFGK